jgi:hypothetical protein
LPDPPIRSLLQRRRSYAKFYAGAVFVAREWLWLRYCRYIPDKAVERGHNPESEKMIPAAVLIGVHKRLRR